jgi:hypothetical protein
MKRFIYLLTALLIFTYAAVKSETFETNYNHYSAFAADEENFYIGLHNGFVVQKIESGEATYYNSTNSNLETNYIGEIIINKGTVYITGPGGLFTYADGNFTKIELGSNGARKLHFIDDAIWTFDARSIYRYDGVKTQKYNITKYINSSYEIARIDVHNNYIWISMYSSTGRWENYYSNVQYKTFRFASYNLETNDLITFTEQERGFDRLNTISFQAVSNNEVWVATGRSVCFIYDLESGKWRRNEHLDLIPAGYELKYWEAITDKEGDIWFSIQPRGTNWGKSMPAVYSYKTNTITMKFKDKEFDPNFIVYNFKLLDDYLYMYGSDEYYFVRGDSIITFKDSDYPDETLRYWLANNVKDSFYSLSYSDEENYKIINLSSKEKYDYGLNGKSDLPHPAYNAFLKDDNTELIIGGETVYREYDNLIYQKDEWVRTRDYGIFNNFYDEAFKRFSNGDLVVKAYDEIYGISDTIATNYNNINQDNSNDYVVRAFSIFDDKIYAFGNDKNLKTFISVLDRDNNELFQYNRFNSCLPDFLNAGTVTSIVYIDSIPMQIEIDNQGNIWALTKKSLFKIDENLNCEYVDYLPIRDGRYPSLYMDNLAYSKNEEILFGSSDNAIYNLNNPILDDLNLSEHGLGIMRYFGACSDGNVYMTTEAGGLFRVKNIRELIPVEVVPGKKELGVPINHISFYKDTLYISTDIGVYKLSTSEENNCNQLSNNLFYPNPSSDYINIEETNQTVTIISLTGRVMKQVTGETRIDISDLYSGVYFVRICDRIEKLVKY